MMHVILYGIIGITSIMIKIIEVILLFFNKTVRIFRLHVFMVHFFSSFSFDVATTLELVETYTNFVALLCLTCCEIYCEQKNSYSNFICTKIMIPIGPISSSQLEQWAS